MCCHPRGNEPGFWVIEEIDGKATCQEFYEDFSTAMEVGNDIALEYNSNLINISQSVNNGCARWTILHSDKILVYVEGRYSKI